MYTGWVEVDEVDTGKDSDDKNACAGEDVLFISLGGGMYDGCCGGCDLCCMRGRVYLLGRQDAYAGEDVLFISTGVGTYDGCCGGYDRCCKRGHVWVLGR